MFFSKPQNVLVNRFETWIAQGQTYVKQVDWKNPFFMSLYTFVCVWTTLYFIRKVPWRSKIVMIMEEIKIAWDNVESLLGSRGALNSQRSISPIPAMIAQLIPTATHSEHLEPDESMMEAPESGLTNELEAKVLRIMATRKEMNEFKVSPAKPWTASLGISRRSDCDHLRVDEWDTSANTSHLSLDDSLPPGNDSSITPNPTVTPTAIHHYTPPGGSTCSEHLTSSQNSEVNSHPRYNPPPNYHFPNNNQYSRDNTYHTHPINNNSFIPPTNVQPPNKPVAHFRPTPMTHSAAPRPTWAPADIPQSSTHVPLQNNPATSFASTPLTQQAPPPRAVPVPDVPQQANNMTAQFHNSVPVRRSPRLQAATRYPPPVLKQNLADCSISPQPYIADTVGQTQFRQVPQTQTAEPNRIPNRILAPVVNRMTMPSVPTQQAQSNQSLQMLNGNSSASLNTNSQASANTNRQYQQGIQPAVSNQSKNSENVVHQSNTRETTGNTQLQATVATNISQTPSPALIAPNEMTQNSEQGRSLRQRRAPIKKATKDTFVRDPIPLRRLSRTADEQNSDFNRLRTALRYA